MFITESLNIDEALEIEASDYGLEPTLESAMLAISESLNDQMMLQRVAYNIDAVEAKALAENDTTTLTALYEVQVPKFITEIGAKLKKAWAMMLELVKKFGDWINSKFQEDGKFVTANEGKCAENLAGYETKGHKWSIGHVTFDAEGTLNKITAKVDGITARDSESLRKGITALLSTEDILKNEGVSSVSEYREKLIKGMRVAEDKMKPTASDFGNMLADIKSFKEEKKGLQDLEKNVKGLVKSANKAFDTYEKEVKKAFTETPAIASMKAAYLNKYAAGAQLANQLMMTLIGVTTKMVSQRRSEYKRIVFEMVHYKPAK